MTPVAPEIAITPDVAIEPLPPVQLLEQQWRALEDAADGCYFTSWSWIGHWLASLPDDMVAQLLVARLDGRIVGLAILVERRAIRYRLMPVLQGSLNATGIAKLDALMIEYNDILLDRRLGAGTREIIFKQLLKHSHIEEFHANGVREAQRWPAMVPTGYRCSALERLCRGVDLAEVRAKGEYLLLISSNTRTKIRKALKDAAKLGPLRVEIASGHDQASTMYDAMCELHGETWRARGAPGAFANEYLCEFHRTLITERLGSGEIQLASVFAGEQLLGVIYNFVYRGRVYSYQSGLDYSEASGQYRPGLILHSLLIDHNAKLGHAYYDLMAGDSQYKRSLGTRCETLQWVVYQRDTLKFRIEHRLRAMKQRLTQRLALGKSGSPAGGPAGTPGAPEVDQA